MAAPSSFILPPSTYCVAVYPGEPAPQPDEDVAAVLAYLTAANWPQRERRAPTKRLSLQEPRPTVRVLIGERETRRQGEGGTRRQGDGGRPAVPSPGLLVSRSPGLPVSLSPGLLVYQVDLPEWADQLLPHGDPLDPRECELAPFAP